MKYFDYESVARECGLSDKDLAALKEAVRAEFPTDDMLWELHVLRACSAITDGHATPEDVIKRLAA